MRWVQMRCKTFSTEFFDCQIQSKKFNLFRRCKKARFGLQSEKAVFDPDKSDCIRNGPRVVSARLILPSEN